MAQPILEFTAEITAAARRELAYQVAADALRDPRGITVRWAPWRQTVMHDLPCGERIFRKRRTARLGDARREWRALTRLAELGLQVPRPLFLAIAGRESVLGLGAVPGRPIEALLAEGAGLNQALSEMPAVVRRLHGGGWVYRDLYWNHVFADPAQVGLWLVDVERAFRPRIRLDRWRVKDLAGLVSSLPSAAVPSRTQALRFLAEAWGGLPADYKRIVRRILAKAGRIRGHRTRYPG